MDPITSSIGRSHTHTEFNESVSTAPADEPPRPLKKKSKIDLPAGEADAKRRDLGGTPAEDPRQPPKKKSKVDLPAGEADAMGVLRSIMRRDLGGTPAGLLLLPASDDAPWMDWTKAFVPARPDTRHKANQFMELCLIETALVVTMRQILKGCQRIGDGYSRPTPPTAREAQVLAEQDAFNDARQRLLDLQGPLGILMNDLIRHEQRHQHQHQPSPPNAASARRRCSSSSSSPSSGRVVPMIDQALESLCPDVASLSTRIKCHLQGISSTREEEEDLGGRSGDEKDRIEIYADEDAKCDPSDRGFTVRGFAIERLMKDKGRSNGQKVTGIRRKVVRLCKDVVAMNDKIVHVATYSPDISNTERGALMQFLTLAQSAVATTSTTRLSETMKAMDAIKATFGRATLGLLQLQSDEEGPTPRPLHISIE